MSGTLRWPPAPGVRARLADPETPQRRALARVLRALAPTPWGRDRGLDSRMTLEDFAALPATGDAELGRFVGRILAGERDAMAVGRAVGLARTSGTTGPPRLLPVTAAHRSDLLAFARRLFLRRLRPGLPRLDRWLLVTASTETVDAGGLPVGYVSGLLQDVVRRAPGAFALPDPDIAAVEDRDARIERLVAVSRGRRVGILYGVPADLVDLLERLTAEVGRPAGEVWPGLDAVYWTGTHLGAARARIERLVGEPLDFREVYGGAEGAFGADWRGTGGLRLADDRVVFAFDPLEGGRRRLLHEMAGIPAGSRFELLVTTVSGLVQYRVGDILEVAEEGSLAFVVAGRVGETLSLAGEALTPHEAQGALAEAARGPLVVGDWLVSPPPLPGPADPPAHRWVVEVVAGPRQPVAVAAALDEALRRRSARYAGARAAGRLAAPEVLVLPAGAFAAHRRAVCAPGGPVKVRPLAATWAEALARPGLGPVLAPLDAVRPRPRGGREP